VYFITLLIFKPSTLTLSFIRQSVLITGGIDINWLVLLMLQFAIAFPLISFLKNKFRVGFILLFLISLFSATWLLFYRIPVPYKAVMWLPWITMAYFGLFFALTRRSTRFLVFSFIISLTGFILLRILEQKLGHSLQMYNNKYPPNLYFLAYGTTIVPFLLLLTRWGIFAWKPVEKYLVFLSKNSFPIYFIHSIILFLLTTFAFQKHMDWFSFFITLLGSSSLVQYLIVIFGRKITAKSS
jgi:peptidoglycan/LPS O-acetylase OafA/YrhL